MLKQEKTRAAAAEASLHGTSVPSDTRQQTATTKEHKTDASSDISHHNYQLQNNSSTSDQPPEQQRTHRPSHKGGELNYTLELEKYIMELLFVFRIVSCKARGF